METKNDPSAPLEDNAVVNSGEGDDAVIGQAFRYSLAVIGGVVLIAGLVFLALRRAPEVAENKETEQQSLSTRSETETAGAETGGGAAVRIPAVTFSDVTDAAGIDFVHVSGATGEKLLPETMGGGCAFFDADGDGDQDLLFINSRRWQWDRKTDQKAPVMSLYANDGEGVFSDVTEQVGLAVPLYGMGCAVADYDNDGDSDIFVSCVGGNHLFRNDQGTFVDVTKIAAIAGEVDRWSTSCGWFDYDNDGLLDLYVCNYVQWSREIDLGQDFRLVGVGRAYGPPTAFSGTFPYLYHNEGDGTFSDVSASMGVQVKNNDTGVPVAKSMGLAPIDINRDGWIDLIVANDTVQNFLFINEQGKRFKELGQVAGIAYDSKGSARGAMGIDTAHFRNGRLSNGKISNNLSTIGVAIGNFANEMSALYVSEGGQMNFRDEAVSTGLGPPTRLDLTFGLFFFDYDLDARLDLFGANGHLEEEINKVQPSQFHAQEPQLFWNAGLGGRSEFLRVANDTLGSGFASRIVGRGSACADIDSDGDLDVVLTAAGGKPRLLRNDQETGNHWVQFLLKGHSVNRDAIGSWIEIYCGEDVLRRQVMPTRSYLSQSDKTVCFGLGQHGTIDRVLIHWAGAATQELGPVAVDQLHRVEQE